MTIVFGTDAQATAVITKLAVGTPPVIIPFTVDKDGNVLKFSAIFAGAVVINGDFKTPDLTVSAFTALWPAAFQALLVQVTACRA
jgi:hypothetical protein